VKSRAVKAIFEVNPILLSKFMVNPVSCDFQFILISLLIDCDRYIITDRL